MGSEITELTDNLDAVQNDAAALLEQIGAIKLDWASLQWSSKGPGQLFEQFKLAGGWADYITNAILNLEHRKNTIVGSFDNHKAQIERSIEKALKDNGKALVLQNYAYQERQAFARIEVGGAVWDAALFEKKLEQVNATLGLIKTKAKQLTDFKGDAKVAANLLSFGNALGELR